jgi:YggT family protein
MFILANILSAIVYVLDTLLWIYMIIVFVACLISWFKPDPYNPIVRLLYNLTEPAFWRIRKWFPFVYVRGIDLSPLVLLILLRVIQMAVIKSLYEMVALMVR